MKELTIEQKAKKYDEALEKAKKELQVCGSADCDASKQIFRFFPELKESKNENIKKTLIDYFNTYKKQEECGINTFFGIPTDNIIAWLEKQGEQPQGKSALEAVREDKVDNQNCAADNVKSKFKAGDWIINSEGTVAHINNVKEDIYGILRYYIEFSNGIKSDHMSFFIDLEYHLWTIQDAKEGDVLVGKIDGDDYILIFKLIKDGWIETYGHYYDAVDRFCVPSQLFCRDCKGKFYPATKEQRDTLYKAMADAGWEFDFKKKELKKIEQKPQRIISAEAKEAVWQTCLE